MIRDYVFVLLRGHENGTLVEVESHDVAIECVRFVATTYLMHEPEKRRGCWLVTRAGTLTRVTDEGVENVTAHVPIAAFDSREVAGVQAVRRDDEKEDD